MKSILVIGMGKFGRHLSKLLLELGNGFSFIARQKRLLIEDDEFFIDMVFL